MPKVIKEKGKSVYFIKLKGVKVTSKDISKVVSVGELSQEPLENLRLIMQEVYLPLISNPANQNGWGDHAAKDVVEMN